MTEHDGLRLRDIADAFDYFLVDQFGVLHDGIAPYAGAPEALMALKQAGKTVLLLSNSGKRSAANEARLWQLGFPQGGWDRFLSSGEVAWTLLAQVLAERQESRPLRCLLLARGGDRSATDGLPLELVDDGATADLVVISGSETDSRDISFYDAALRSAAQRQVPCYCTNPDKTMLTSLGPRPGAGHLAERYERMGGVVRWIGKPYPQIYEAARHLLGNPPAARMVCVGDSIEHDIVGGQNAGLATALVATGILAGLGDVGRSRLFAEHGVVPTVSLPAFVW